jgi:hypothetical protein
MKISEHGLFVGFMLGCIVIFAFDVWASIKISNLEDNCAPGLVLKTPHGWICTEVIPR